MTLVLFWSLMEFRPCLGGLTLNNTDQLGSVGIYDFFFFFWGGGGGWRLVP